jgi:hypothetical protein
MEYYKAIDIENYNPTIKLDSYQKPTYGVICAKCGKAWDVLLDGPGTYVLVSKKDGETIIAEQFTHSDTKFELVFDGENNTAKNNCLEYYICTCNFPILTKFFTDLVNPKGSLEIEFTPDSLNQKTYPNNH